MSTPRIEPDRVDELADRVREGQVFVLPTDTAYGLGASLDHPESVRRVFEIKQRPLEKSVPVLLDRGDLDDRFSLSSVEERAIDDHWPGGLTLVLSVEEACGFPPGTTRERTLAAREPAHEPLLTILRETGPITGTSANLSGGATPGSIDAVESDILDRVDFVLSGPEVSGQSSTVAEWNWETGEWTIHREGPVSRHDLIQDTTGRIEEETGS